MQSNKSVSYQESPKITMSNVNKVQSCPTYSLYQIFFFGLSKRRNVI